jgi:hypothetical protein
VGAFLLRQQVVSAAVPNGQFVNGLLTLTINVNMRANCRIAVKKKGLQDEEERPSSGLLGLGSRWWLVWRRIARLRPDPSEISDRQNNELQTPASPAGVFILACAHPLARQKDAG